MSEGEPHPSHAPRAVAALATSARKGRREGVEIKPGTVRQARVEAGLSLAKVASGVVSRTAIYFVETGKAKPSMETLRLIAERTGRPIDFFLADPSTIEPRSSAATLELEGLVAAGELEQAVQLGHAMLERRISPETAAHVKQLLALAHLRLADPRQGRTLAEQARHYFEIR